MYHVMFNSKIRTCGYGTIIVPLLQHLFGVWPLLRNAENRSSKMLFADAFPLGFAPFTLRFGSVPPATGPLAGRNAFKVS